MGVIQNSVNKILTLGTAAARLSPSYQNRQEAKAALSGAESATSGLADIEANAKAGKFANYSEEQLKDVANRTSAHNKAINDLRTAEQNPRYQKYLEKMDSRGKVPTGSAYSQTLKNIEGALQSERMSRQAVMQRVSDIGNNSIEQGRDFGDLLESLEDKGFVIDDTESKLKELLKRGPNGK